MTALFEQLAKCRLAVGAPRPPRRDGLAQHVGGDDLVTFESHLRHGGFGTVGPENDDELIAAHGFEFGDDLLLHVSRGGQFLERFCEAVQHGAGGGQFASVQRIAGFEEFGRFGIRNAEVGEAHRVNRLYLQHLKGGSIAVGVRRGPEFIADRFE